MKNGQGDALGIFWQIAPSHKATKVQEMFEETKEIEVLNMASKLPGS